MLTQLLHRWDGHRLRRILLLRPFGPAIKLGDDTTLPQLPPYDADADLAPRTPQMLEYTLEPEDYTLVRETPPLAVGCDRSGACCGQYPIVPTSPAERDRALVTLGRAPTTFLPFDPAEAFAPAFPGSAVPLTPVFAGDGCVFLSPDGCRLHALGGPSAKPATCRQFPLQVIHDGTGLELSILPHCACAARCTRPGTADDWDHDLVASYTTVPMVPPTVAVDEHRSLPRSAYLPWVRALADVLAAEPPESPRALLDQAARSLGLPPARITEAWLEQLEERALDEADRLETYQPSTAPQPLGLRWVAELAALALERTLDETLPEPISAPTDASVLALALRAHLLLELPTIESALTDLSRIVTLTGWARAFDWTASLDRRLEPLPLLLYLWASTRWPVSSEPNPPR